MLGAAEDGEADVAVDLEDPAAVLERNCAAIDVAALGIEDVTAGPAVAVFRHAPEDLEAEDGLVFERAGAVDAERMGNGRVEELFDGAVELAVPFADGDDGFGLAGVVVDGLPAADGRVEIMCLGAGGRGLGRGSGGRQQHDKKEQREAVEGKLTAHNLLKALDAGGAGKASLRD